MQTVRESIARRLRGRYAVKILTVPQTLAYHQAMVDRAFVFTYAIQLLVVAVTLAGRSRSAHYADHREAE